MMFAEEIRSIADEAAMQKAEKRRNEAIKWANEYIEPRMKEVAQKGEYRLSINLHTIPVDYHELKKFLQEQNFHVDFNSNNGEVFILW